MSVVVSEVGVHAWDQPDGVTARGTVVVIPGRGEHGGVYERLGRRLALDAYRVRALDRAPSSVDSARAAVADVLTADLPRPFVVAGSDAGAVFALAVAADSGVDGAIVAGYPVAAPFSAATVADEIEARTSCPVHAARLRDDPRFAPAGLATTVPAADAVVPGRVRVPVLALHGADDAVSPYSAARAELAAVPDIVLVTLAGGRHDAFNDRSHRTAAAHIVLFLEDLRGGTATATSERLD